jgi:hypothetical protein
MNKMLSALIAAVFAASTFSAVAAEAPAAAAAASTEAAPAAADTAAPKKVKKHKMTANQEKMISCKKDAKEQKLKGDERKSFIKDCMSKEEAPAAAGTETAKPKAKKHHSRMEKRHASAVEASKTKK